MDVEAPKKILVASDTHDRPEPLLNFLKEHGSKFRGSYLIHLGDIMSHDTLRRIVEEAKKNDMKVIAFFGNNSGSKLDIMTYARFLGAEVYEGPKEIRIGDKKLLLLHGKGRLEKTHEITRVLADAGEWDIILYGHTHFPEVVRRSDTLIINPGEAGGIINSPTLAILDLKTMEAKIVDLENRYK